MDGSFISNIGILMAHTRPRIAALLLTAVSGLLSQVQPLFAQHVPGIEWKQRETDRFVIIYPDTLSRDAEKLAGELDAILADASSGLPPSHPPKKWPLVLTDLGVETNGYVSLMPRRTVWHASPGEDFTASSDWWGLLARHEGRHLAQFDAADQGFTRALHLLFGGIGLSVGLLSGTPLWLLEGDAVVVETLLSQEGRGRDPLFTQELTALLMDKPDSGYNRIVNTSYRTHHTDPYRLGYAMAGWIRRTYGEDALREIYRLTARIPLPVIGLNLGTRKATGKLPRHLFEEMADELVGDAESRRESGSWTPGEVVSPESGRFTRYDPLFVDHQENVFARRADLANAPRLVRIAPDRREQPLMRLPEGGRVSMARLGSQEGEESAVHRVVWNALRRHPVFEGHSVSDLTVMDLNHRGRVIRRLRPVTGSRLLYPALSPEGRRIAAVDFPRGNGSALVILDAVSGEELHRFALIDSTAAYPSWSPDGESLVFSRRSYAGREIVEWSIGSPTLKSRAPLSKETVKKPVYSPDGRTVYYSSNSEDLETVQSVSLVDGKRRTMARRWYGAYDPLPSPDGRSLYLVEYASSAGERIVRIDLGPNREPDEEGPGETPDVPGETASPDEGPIGGGPPETEYRPAGHAVNFHSWGFGLDLPEIQTLTLSLSSRDVLGTLEFQAGALYDTIEQSPGGFGKIAFIGIRPIISIRGDYRYRGASEKPVYHFYASADLNFPMNLSRSGIWDHDVILEASGGFQSFGTEPRMHPFLSYRAEWLRLRPGSYRALQPEWGWRLRTAYSHIPLPDVFGDSVSGELKLYMPGGFRNTSLRFRGGIERRTANFTTRIGRARGYGWENPGLTLLAGADYEFPLGYPDLPLGAVVYVQRFRFGFYSDWAWIGGSDALEKGGPYSPRYSSGAYLNMDHTFFNVPFGLSLGFRFNWLWQENRASFDILVQDLEVW